MRWIGVAISLVAILLIGHAAAEEVQKSEAAASKAKALEQNAAGPNACALYFHQRNVTPAWSAEYIKTVEIGEVIFYKPHNGLAK